MKKVLKITVAILCLAAICAALLTGCADKPKGEVMEEDTVFYINSIKTNLIDVPEGIWILILCLFDSQNTYVKLGADGKLTLQLKLLEDLSKTMTTLQEWLEFDLSGLSEMDLRGMADIYAAALFPGFSLTEGKVRESVELLRSLGAALNLDYEDEEVKKLIDSIGKTGHVNEDFTIPKKVEIFYQGEYEIKHLPSINGEKTIIFTDEYGENGEPYLLFDMLTDEETGARTVHLRIDFLELDLYATEKV